MVILITGATHTGKTLLAQRLLEQLQFPYLSIDHLKMGLIRSGNTALTPEDDDALTGYLWPIIREIIKTAIENGQNLIVEGCYVPFDWRQEFEETYQKDIRFLCLAMSERYIEMHYDRIAAHACDIEDRGDDADCSMELLKKENRAVLDGFQHAREKVTVIDGDYEKSMDALMQLLDNRP